ncbi:hypothetical protein B0H17DRAFT_1144461 [Mycena rosella]|uniref:Uncharacterized protein n=1 Tax=Mycena rosella TaxID=1033263 RepID=A0AAD7CSV5_MYCRO|nr:hypothetical protein B0H17DRAFT_1144461 [Mycena rosella]
MLSDQEVNHSIEAFLAYLDVLGFPSANEDLYRGYHWRRLLQEVGIHLDPDSAENTDRRPDHPFRKHNQGKLSGWQYIEDATSSLKMLMNTSKNRELITAEFNKRQQYLEEALKPSNPNSRAAYSAEEDQEPMFWQEHLLSEDASITSAVAMSAASAETQGHLMAQVIATGITSKQAKLRVHQLQKDHEDLKMEYMSLNSAMITLQADSAQHEQKLMAHFTALANTHAQCSEIHEYLTAQIMAAESSNQDCAETQEQLMVQIATLENNHHDCLEIQAQLAAKIVTLETLHKDSSETHEQLMEQITSHECSANDVLVPKTASSLFVPVRWTISLEAGRFLSAITVALLTCLNSMEAQALESQTQFQAQTIKLQDNIETLKTKTEEGLQNKYRESSDNLKRMKISNSRHEAQIISWFSFLQWLKIHRRKQKNISSWSRDKPAQRKA